MPTDMDRINEYLLGNLPDGEMSAIEDRMFDDEEFFDRIEMAEDELIDAYVEGRLTKGQRSGFETRFLSSPRRRERVRIATELGEIFAGRERSSERASLVARLAGFLGLRGLGLLAAAACGLALVFLGTSLWLARQLVEGRDSALAVKRDQQRQIDQLSAKVRALTPGDNEKAGTPPNQSPLHVVEHREVPALMAFNLVPGAVRNAGEAVLTMGPKTGNINFTLQTDVELLPGFYQVSLQTAEGKKLWTRDVTLQTGQSRDHLMVSVPASLLTEGRYLLTLYAYTPAHVPEVIDDYAFRIRQGH